MAGLQNCSLPIILMIQLSSIVYGSSLCPYCPCGHEDMLPALTSIRCPVACSHFSPASFCGPVWIFHVNRKASTGTIVLRVILNKRTECCSFCSKTVQEHSMSFAVSINVISVAARVGRGFFLMQWPYISIILYADPTLPQTWLCGFEPTKFLPGVTFNRCLLCQVVAVAASSIAQSVKELVFGNSYLAL